MKHYLTFFSLIPLVITSPLIDQLLKYGSSLSPTSVLSRRAPVSNEVQGSFEIIGRSGVPAVHAALMPNNKLVFLNRLETYTELKLPNGRYAYSCLYDPVTRIITPLRCPTNPFCCGGTFLADGRLVTLGGSHAHPWIDDTMDQGFDGIRYLDIYNLGQGWLEPGNKLSTNRWYASAQTMGDGTIFVAARSLTAQSAEFLENNNPTYEILNQNGISTGQSIAMDILVKNMPYWMFPFLHLLPNGYLFVFAAKSSQIFDVINNRIVRQLPDLQGLYRTYPNTGGSVMLPLSYLNRFEVEIMICGGGAGEGLWSLTDTSCGRIKPLANVPEWKMTYMPEGRTMVEAVLLLDGKILWINGARRGAQGWGIAQDPALEALIYDPQRDSWTNAGTSTIPRLYHSVALLLLDGTVLVAGSNPNDSPLSAEEVDPTNPARAFPTEYRMEIFIPPYLIGERATRRPSDIKLSTSTLIIGSSRFRIEFSSKTFKEVEIILYHGGFVTHGLHMGQVMVYLEQRSLQRQTAQRHSLEALMPQNLTLAPGPYVVYVVIDGVPGIGQFVRLLN